jgi:hypothetical protein
MPDAQRGWDVPGAILVPLPVNTSTSTGNASDTAGLLSADERRYIYTQTRLVDIATPDFSMPYNVIMMSCTLIALIFGNILKLLTRRFVAVDVGATVDEPSKLANETEKLGREEESVLRGVEDEKDVSSDSDAKARKRAKSVQIAEGAAEGHEGNGGRRRFRIVR